MMMNDVDHPSNWKYLSSHKEGLHTVIDPGNSACNLIYIFRLNLNAGKAYTLSNKSLELNGAVIEGKVQVLHENVSNELNKFDSFYLPAGEEMIVRAIENCSVYIGGSLYEGNGSYFTRAHDPSLPLGDIHQVHGKPPYRREVFMTVAQQDEASRLICGITIGDPGLWTSWPPHQHSKDLEEVYCYFDIPKPASAFHFSSRRPGKFEFIHSVSTGDVVVIPEGYHPTCGMPGVRSCYFWVMAALHPESRRYDLAENDPNFI